MTDVSLSPVANAIALDVAEAAVLAQAHRSAGALHRHLLRLLSTQDPLLAELALHELEEVTLLRARLVRLVTIFRETIPTEQGEGGNALSDGAAAPEVGNGHDWLASLADLVDADLAAYTLHSQLVILARSRQLLLGELTRRELAVVTPFRARLARLIRLVRESLEIEGCNPPGETS